MCFCLRSSLEVNVYSYYPSACLLSCVSLLVPLTSLLRLSLRMCPVFVSGHYVLSVSEMFIRFMLVFAWGMPVVYTKAYYVHSNDCSSALDVCLRICPFAFVFVSLSPCLSFRMTNLLSIVSRESVCFCFGLFVCTLHSSQSIVSYWRVNT